MARSNDAAYRSQENEVFKAWFEQNSMLFNWSALEAACAIPKKAIYKHMAGHQAMSYYHWDSLRIWVGRYCAVGAKAAGHYVEINYRQSKMF